MTFQVEFSHEARLCLLTILDWLASQSPEGADRWGKALEQAVTRLEELADTFAPSAEAHLFSEPLYELFFKTRAGRKYRIVYLIRNEVVLVVSVQAPGQRLLHPRTTQLPPSDSAQ